MPKLKVEVHKRRWICEPCLYLSEKTGWLWPLQLILRFGFAWRVGRRWSTLNCSENYEVTRG